MDEFQGANVTETAAPSNEQVSSTSTESVNVESATPPVQDRETNAAFAQMRRQTEQAQKDRDALIAEIYGNQGITNYQQYQQAKAQAEAAQQAQQMNVDPRFFQHVQSLEQRLNSYEQERVSLQREQQVQRLKSDPNKGPLYQQWENDINQISNSFNVDPDVAFKIVLDERLGDVLSSLKTQGEQDAVKKLINNSQSSPGSLGQGGERQTNSISNMSKSDFAKLQEQVLRGERKNL